KGPRRAVAQHHAGRDLVNVLPTLAARAHEGFLEIRLANTKAPQALGERLDLAGRNREHVRNRAIPATPCNAAILDFASSRLDCRLYARLSPSPTHRDRLGWYQDRRGSAGCGPPSGIPRAHRH